MKMPIFHRRLRLAAHAFAVTLLRNAGAAGQPESTNSIGLKLGRIEPGTFTMGQEPRDLPTIDRSIATISETMSEYVGYLAITQTRDDRLQLHSSKNHYVFNFAWLRQLPPPPPK